MQFANSVNEMLLAFDPSPLNGKDLEEFYYDGTMEVRTGDRYDSPIQDIYEACKIPSERNIFLLLGHRGCGKSTELNEMSQWLKQDGYPVTIIPCGLDMDTKNPDYSDLLILMGDALLGIAGNLGCTLNKKLEQVLTEFWDERETTTTLLDDSEIELKAGITAETPALIAKLLKLSWKVKSSLKFSEERRTVYRERVTKRLSEWTATMNELADIITEKLEGKQPILIFEDLDKLDAGAAMEVFGMHTTTLSAPTFPVIYTFPIAISYDARFRSLEGYFHQKTFPMIKVKKLSGERCDEGYATIHAIIEKRTRTDLFGENVLDYMIQKTGGSLRDLFRVITVGATRARRRRSTTIEMEDVQRALEELKTTLTKTIERRHYAFLADIAKGNRERIEDRELLLEMLQAGTVLEYNGKRWHDVHPLVVDFLVEQGEIKSGK